MQLAKISKMRTINVNHIDMIRYNKALDESEILMQNHVCHKAKGDWSKIITNLLARGAVWTDGEIYQDKK